jgi:hypothetical protein
VSLAALGRQALTDEQVVLKGHVSLGSQSISVCPLLDTGSGAEPLMDLNLVRAHGLPLYELDRRVRLTTLKGQDVAEAPTHFTTFPLTIRQGNMSHTSTTRAFVTRLGPNPLDHGHTLGQRARCDTPTPLGIGGIHEAEMP